VIPNHRYINDDSTFHTVTSGAPNTPNTGQVFDSGLISRWHIHFEVIISSIQYIMQPLAVAICQLMISVQVISYFIECQARVVHLYHRPITDTVTS
jgi:hypothetical protein